MPARDRRFDTRLAARQASQQRTYTGRFPLETETCWFVLANLLDFVVTYRMLLYRGGAVVFSESNPFAGYFLNRWGIEGLLWFKSVVVLFVCVVAQLAYRRRPDLARLLLIAGTTAVTVIVIYSVRMFFQNI